MLNRKTIVRRWTQMNTDKNFKITGCRVRRARCEASTPGVHHELTVCVCISVRAAHPTVLFVFLYKMNEPQRRGDAEFFIDNDGFGAFINILLFSAPLR